MPVELIHVEKSEIISLKDLVAKVGSPTCGAPEPWKNSRMFFLILPLLLKLRSQWPPLILPHLPTLQCQLPSDVISPHSAFTPLPDQTECLPWVAKDWALLPSRTAPSEIFLRVDFLQLHNWSPSSSPCIAFIFIFGLWLHFNVSRLVVSISVFKYLCLLLCSCHHPCHSETLLAWMLYSWYIRFLYNILIKLLRISYTHIECFHYMSTPNTTPNSYQTPPNSTSSFSNNPLNLVRAAYVLMEVGTSIGAWETYQGLTLKINDSPSTIQHHL